MARLADQCVATISGRLCARRRVQSEVPSISVAADGDERVYAAYTEGAGPGQPYSLFWTTSVDAGRTWSAARRVSDAIRPASQDRADHFDSSIVAQGRGRVCVVWADDRRGALDTFARCSTDAGSTWGRDIWLSNRTDGAGYKTPQGFTAFYGHYGGAAISPSGRLFVAWPEGERDYRTGAVWFNRITLGD